MPNWCSNKLFVKNLKTEDQDLLLRLFDQNTFCESILPQPDWANTPNEKGKLPLPDEEHPELGRRFPDGTHDDRWYSWRNENWGTKWGECDVFGAEVGNGGWFSVAYLTAWSPLNENFLKAFSQRFPGARISTQYQEPGCDYFGVTVAQDGIVNDINGCLSKVSNGWMRENHPDLYERWEASRKEDYEGEDDEDDLWEELWALWSEEESDVVGMALVHLQAHLEQSLEEKLQMLEEGV